MAQRGAKPKPAALRLIDGTRNVTRHGSEADLRKTIEASVTAFGPLVAPKGLKADVMRAWKAYIAPAHWLDGSKAQAAIALCELWAEFRDAPRMFPASKHGQMRAYMSELGLTDERNRKPAETEQKDEFFDD